MKEKILKFLRLSLFTLIFCGCQVIPEKAPDFTTTPTLSIFLPPYLTSTLTPTPESKVQTPSSPLPSATSTPLTHTVKKGEDFGGIAYQYGITLKALTAANPKVNPNLMSVGTVLVIPSKESNADTTPVSILPTPAPIQVSNPDCYPTLNGGLDCFTLVNNPLDIYVESVTVMFRLTNQENGEVTSLAGATPLNLLPPGWSQPLHVLFPSPLPIRYQTTAELVSALPYTISDQRYINIKLENRADNFSPDYLSVEAQGDLILEGDSSSTAAATWVSITAFDSSNRLVGFRRWEATTPLTGGTPVHFMVRVYSAGPVIDHIQLLAEARR